MANRVVRSEILTSDAVNSLSWCGEVFYRRLMSVVDDYGRFDGRASIIRSAIFPLKLEKVSEADIIKWMDECSKAELVSFYQIDKKPFLEIKNFGQTLRIKKSKFPANNVQASAYHMQADVNRLQADVCLKGKETETESRVETETENLIIIMGEKFLKKGSEVLQDEYRSVLNQHMMGALKGYSESQVLSKFDLEYPNYEFKDRNHLSNALKGIGEKISKKRSPNEPITTVLTMPKRIQAE